MLTNKLYNNYLLWKKLKDYSEAGDYFMVKTRDFSEVKLHSDPWKPTKPVYKYVEVNGFDTETHKGTAFLVTYSTKHSDYALELSSRNGFDDFINTFYQKIMMESVNFFYNIDYDFAALAKFLGEKKLQDLATAGLTNWKEFQIKWIPAKHFSIMDDNGHGLNFYDVAQFYNKQSLKNVAPLVGEEKLEFDVSAIDFDRYNSDDNYRDLLIEYAKTDSRITRKLGLRLHNAVNEIIPVRQYFSTATIAQTFFLSKIKTKISMPPNAVIESALQSYNGGRFELIRRGHFDSVYEIDINSAYPKEFSELPDITNGNWAKVEKNEMNPNAILGFYKVDVKTHGYLLSPIIQRIKDVICYPHGNHKDIWLELSELKILDEMGYRPIIREGYEYFDYAPKYPFSFIQELYKMRKEFKNQGREDLDYVFKIILNSAYGKTIQLMPDTVTLSELPVNFDTTKIVREIEKPNGEIDIVVRTGWKAGKMFNPVYAATITARVRSKLLQTVIRNNLEKSLIGFATDCLFLKDKPPQSVIGEGLGSWKNIFEKPCEGLFIGSGIYTLRPYDEKIKTINHFRGFQTKNDIFTALKENKLKFEFNSPVKLKEGVRGGQRQNGVKINYESIGQFLPQIKELDINFDKKRTWERNAKNAKDLLENEIESRPLVI